MEEQGPLTERILHLTLEIIHLLTGEKCAVVKMVSIEGLLQGMYPPMSGERSRSPSVDPPPPYVISEKKNEKKILEVTQKMIELLTGEVLLEECRSVRKKASMENQHTSADDLPGRTEMPQTSIAGSEESCPPKEQHLLDGGDNIEVDYTMVNVKEEDLLDGGSWTPRILPMVNDMEDIPRNVKISDFERCPQISDIKEELGVTNFRAECTKDKGVCLEQQVDAVSLWVKDRGITGNPLLVVRDELNEVTQSGPPYWPPSLSSETYCRPSFTSTSKSLQGLPPFSCPECGKFFDRIEQLERHRRIHTGPKPYSCLQCQKSFWIKSQLMVHQKVHEVEKPFSCAICSKSFSRQQALDSHMLTHSGERPYACAECGRCFSRKSLLVIHRRIHSGEKPYSCLECNRFFRHKTALVAHQRTHTGERPYHCSVCEKCYTHSSHLVVHLRSHSGEKPYSCLECEKCFSQKSALVRHQRIHTVK